jgi:CRP-like cAMP-binding protein
MLTHDLLAVATWNPCVTDMIHVANVLYLLSYMVRDILWLRVLSVAAGERLVAQGSVVEDMTVLLQGALEVRADGRAIARLRPGQFVGEMSFITGEKASADVIATEPSTVVSCAQASLHELLDTKPALALKIRAALGRDVVAKLRAHAGNGA